MTEKLTDFSIDDIVELSEQDISLVHGAGSSLEFAARLSSAMEYSV
ncbi:MAG TPA: hypothetical protein VEA80_00980 [Vitreimonas sp.]|nr:hypothetical protein [Vitreimonas sp.]HYD86025.1 hypothetical protein [Vitreimonas sp.]